MRCVIIDKTFSSSDRSKGPYKDINKLFPDDYPLVCLEEEFKSINDAKAKYPGKLVMTVPQYNQWIGQARQQYKDAISARNLKDIEIGNLKIIANEG